MTSRCGSKREEEVLVHSPLSNKRTSATLNDDDTTVVAVGSAAASTSSRSTNGQKAPVPPFAYHKEKADDSPSVSRGQKSPEQLERRRERRRLARQARRMTKSDKQNPGSTPKAFMQWKESEALKVQRIRLELAHQAELQKQELRLILAHQAELQKQELRLKSAHQVELQDQAAVMNQRDQQHERENNSTRWTRMRTVDDMPDWFCQNYDHTHRGKLSLGRVDDGTYTPILSG